MLLGIPVLLFAVALLVVYLRQDEIIQSQVAAMNEQYQGHIVIGATHLDPFWDFPNVSVEVEDVRIYEFGTAESALALQVQDIYVSFGLIRLLRGDYTIKTLLVEEGFFNLVMHEDGTNNLQNALATGERVEELDGVEEPGGLLDFHLEEIRLRNLDIHHYDEASEMDVELYIYSADGGFRVADTLLTTHIDTELELNVMEGGDTTFLKHKHFEFHTDVALNTATGMVRIAPSGLTMEHGDFELEGTVATQQEMALDLEVRGTKPNFDMLIAFAPEDLIPVLEQYNNEGNIYFNAVIEGPTAGGQLPYVEANFGASEAFLENTAQGARMEDVGFRGYFTTGEARSLETMEFSLVDMKATMEEGSFVGKVVVKNFAEPEVEAQVDADFNLEFLAAFLNLEGIRGAAGRVAVRMNFHDIIDLVHPERALSELDQAYFAELTVEGLSLTSEQLPAPLEALDLHLIMNGKKADLNQFEMKLGNTDVSVTGWVSDLPAIVHHTSKPVEAHLSIAAGLLDVAELTGYSAADSTGIDEQIEDLTVGFSFITSARAITESRYLPRGEFFVDSLHAQLKHYPHELHDFHVDVAVDDEDLTIVDFMGFIDDSDFHLNGLMHDYGFWMQPELNGEVDLDLTLSSDLLRLEDIFSYQGENYVPEDYRHEELEDLVVHVNSSLHFKQSELHSIDLDIDKVQAKMHLHPMRFEEFAGRVHYEDDHLVVERFHGKLGRTVFDLDLNYYLGEDPTVRKRDNFLTLKANYIDFDELFSFNTAAPGVALPDSAQANAHEEAYNLYDLPFTDMAFSVDVGHFIYHRVDLQQIKARLRATQDHYLYVDTLDMQAAGGDFHMSGYFNGSDPEHIYLKPKLRVEHADVDGLLFKFESHGEDEPLSENIHGSLTADITGNIRMYPDFIPNLDESEIHMDVQVLDGRLVDYKPMLMLTDYMGDKDLTNIRFDTLVNHMDLTNGVLNIPSMTIESTLGHFEVSGQQDLADNLEYYIRIPWNIITQGTRNKLFGGRNKDEAGGEDEIVKVDPKRNVRYLNLKIAGTLDDYSVSLGKDNEE